MTRATLRNVRFLRRLSQTFFLLLFLWLITNFSPSSDIPLSNVHHAFFYSDPLLAVSALFSSRPFVLLFLLSFLTIAVTMATGRFFCGWVCPFGTLHHAAGRLRRSSHTAKKNERISSGLLFGRSLKYAVLFLCVFLALFTSLNPGIVDPLMLLTRSMVSSVLPAGRHVTVQIHHHAMDSPFLPVRNLVSHLGNRLPGLAAADKTALPPGAVLLGLIFIGLLALNLYQPRFWCRVLCPLGALLGLCARASRLTLRVHAAQCSERDTCLSYCQGGVLPSEKGGFHDSECFRCFNCAAGCRHGTVHFTLTRSNRNDTTVPDPSLRGFLAAVGAALVTIPLLRATRRRRLSTSLIRPPGARPERDFISACLRCGACMQVCPTNALHPAFAESGIEGIWTPRLVPRIGYCVYSCTRCGEICPSGALQKLRPADKMGTSTTPPWKLGAAVVDRSRCLAWSEGITCLACAGVCPVSPRAIRKEKNSGANGMHVDAPRVDENSCIGCGHCEYVCPVEGRAAIQVKAHTREKIV